MTENEAKVLLCQMYIPQFDEKEKQALSMAIQALEEIQQYRAIGTVDEVKILKDFKELYDAYNLIGTIEEFRNLKYKKNVLPIATIEFIKEDMQKIVDETCLKIFNYLLSEIEWNRVLVDDWDALAEEFKEVAEQLKAGEIDG